jgi:abortive infection bacteriophage resistance protein
MASRGLLVGDRTAALHYLTHIGYYRLSGYALAFQQADQGSSGAPHQFLPGTTFDAILDLYVFDRKLRLVAMDAIERIEVSLRAIMTNALAPIHGAHWYMDSRLFDPKFRHADFLYDIRNQIGHCDANRRDQPIAHYYTTYSTPSMPPSWMVFESISFGTISRAYSFLLPAQFNAVRASFNEPHKVLRSWFHSINYIRNICAHHGRLWHRDFRIKPLAADRYKADMAPNDRLYAQLLVMQVLLSKSAPDNHWATKLRDLLSEHPAVPLATMGFPSGWQSRPIWGL